MRRTRIKVFILIGVGVILCTTLFYIEYRFQGALATYIAAARGHDTATYIPGAPDNATRRILNRILADILTQPHSEPERLALAKEGLDALSVSEQEIDAIGTLGENVTSSLALLESRPTLLYRKKRTELLALAHKRFEIAADIRGLSYLANHHIAEIFNRIIADGGALTAEHRADLNNKIPEVETDYDRRAALYRELESTIAASNRLTGTAGQGQ